MYENIRIGTLVSGLDKDPVNYIRQILPHGFESFGINFWEHLHDTDLGKLAAGVRGVLNGSGAILSHLGIFGNPLESDEKAALARAGWEKLIDAAGDFGVDLVAGFTGRLRGKPLHESIARYREVFGPLAERAAKKNVRIAFENCSMGGTWQDGDWNIAINPTAWELMFEALPAANIGLQWEPCHQMVQLIDPLPQLKQWVGKIFNVHGKDASIHWDVIREHGVISSYPKPKDFQSAVRFVPDFANHRTPGFGDSNWTDIISELRIGGYHGSIDIEGWHDPVYRDELEMTGQVHALNYLKRCRGGDYVPNPS